MPSAEFEWVIAPPPDDHPGYLGKRRTLKEEEWTGKYGEGGWRYRWQTADGEVLDYDQIFQIYVDGYANYFKRHLGEAWYLTEHYAYGYDHDLITKEQAFDPYALYDKPGVRNQFHNVAFNIALVTVIGRPFQGVELIQVREGKPGTPVELQPAGYRWAPGRIPCKDTSIIPQITLPGEQWWADGSVEDLYQKAKILQIRLHQ